MSEITAICESAYEATFGSDILGRIYGGVVASHENGESIVNPKLTHKHFLVGDDM